MKATLILALFFCGTFLTLSLQAQSNPAGRRDTLPPADDARRLSRLPAGRDTLPVYQDSAVFKVKYSKDSLDAPVDYGSRDSMFYDIKNKKVYLWGAAFAKYTTITLKADFIILDLDSSIVTATGLPDSTGKVRGLPEFEDGQQRFVADRMRYNFKTRKGKTYNVTTQQNDVVVKGTQSKFISGQPTPGDSTRSNDVAFNQGAIFTTCTADHPHFGIRSSKQKVIPDKLVVVGPSNLEIMGIPTPLWLPFGFFPITKGRSTGLLFPADYEYSPTWGFGLRDMGWFFPLGDHFNAAIRSNIYLKGRWGVTVASDYRKRYKYNGGLSIGYEKLINEDSEGNITRPTSFLFNWRHQQDRSAHPSITLGGSINIQSNNYRQRVFNDAQNVLQNQLNSNFSFTKVWQDKPLNFSAAFSHSQNTATRTVNITFPNLQFLTQTLYPLRRRERVGQEKWYETITLRYTADARTTFTTADTTLFTRQMFENGQYGMRQSATSGTSFKLFRYFNLNPGVNFDEVWYFNTLRKNFDETPVLGPERVVYNADRSDSTIVRDTLRFGTLRDFRQFGFASFRSLSASVALNTQLFGTLQFRRGWLRGLRHVAKVSTSLNYAPNFGDELDYIRFTRFDTRFPDSLQRYSIFENGAFGQPPVGGQQFTIGYSINNIFEAKIRKDTADQKIKLFDNLVVGGNYNLSADSLRWSQVSATGTARFFKDITTLSMLVRFDPYALAPDERGNFRRIDRFQFRENGQILRFSDANLRFNTVITVSRIRELFQGKTPEVVENINQPRQNNSKEEDFLSLFENFSINHNFVFGWNTDLRTGKPVFDLSINSINVQGNIQLTKNWRINLGNFGYDFENKDFTYPSLGFSRDLHCWEMGMNAQPTRATYSFFISVKPGTLGFLKVPYQRNNADILRATQVFR